MTAPPFNKVWHQGVLHKIEQNFTAYYYQLLKSYLEDRTTYVKIQNFISDIYNIGAGVPQGSVLGPILFTLYTADIPTTEENTLLTFAGDTAILLASHDDPKSAFSMLQHHFPYSTLSLQQSCRMVGVQD